MCGSGIAKAANALTRGAVGEPASSIMGIVGKPAGSFLGLSRVGTGVLSGESNPVLDAIKAREVAQAQRAEQEGIRVAQAQQPELLRLMGRSVLDTTILGQNRKPSSVAYTGRTLGGG